MISLLFIEPLAQSIAFNRSQLVGRDSSLQSLQSSVVQAERIIIMLQCVVSLAMGLFSMLAMHESLTVILGVSSVRFYLLAGMMND